MIYTAEQHLKAAHQQEQRARSERDPKKREALLKSAMRHKIVAKAAKRKQHQAPSAPVVREVPKTAQSVFLAAVEAKFRELVKQEPDPAREIADAAARLIEAGLLFSPPDPGANPKQAAFLMIGDNELLTEIWMEVRDNDYWQAAETPAELITALLPKNDGFD